MRARASKGRVLAFPYGKGTTYNPFTLFAMKKRGTAPVAIINVKAEEIVLTGAILVEIPFIDRLDEDPFEVIESGDFVKVDGDTGTVEVVKRKHRK